jgi:NADH-quinone oxidoreductase subunit A
MSPTSIVAYLVLFVGAGFAFVLAAMILGRLVRPRAPVPEKLETYECGEPTVGTSFVQFDLRFYVVALVFIVFDVEVAFFFPWAVVFGKATQLMAGRPAVEQPTVEPGPASAAPLSPTASAQLRQLGVDPRAFTGTRLSETREPVSESPGADAESSSEALASTARRLAGAAMADMVVFFAVLMVGFAYVWSRGDLNWVRAVSRRTSPAGETGQTETAAAATAID